MEEERGEKELGKGECLESDCEEIRIIYPVTNAACFELYALHLDSLCLDQVLKSKISLSFIEGSKELWGAYDTA